MAHLIDRDSLVCEIKKNLRFIPEHITAFDEGEEHAYHKIFSFIDTLEVKEVDLEDSVKETLTQKYIDYIFKRHNIDPESKEGQLIYYAYMHGMNQCLDQLNNTEKRII